MRDFFAKLAILRMIVGHAYHEWKTCVWRANLDAPYCCDGRECGCEAMTVREIYSAR